MMQAFVFDIGLLLVAYLGRLLKNAHLLRFSHSALQSRRWRDFDDPSTRVISTFLSSLKKIHIC
jgi:hypothetical protein